MTDLQALADMMRKVASELERTGHPYDAAWAKHLGHDATAMVLLSMADRHRNVEVRT